MSGGVKWAKNRPETPVAWARLKRISCFIKWRAWCGTWDHETLIAIKMFVCFSLPVLLLMATMEIMKVRCTGMVVGENSVITDVDVVASWIKSHE